MGTRARDCISSPVIAAIKVGLPPGSFRSELLLGNNRCPFLPNPSRAFEILLQMPRTSEIQGDWDRFGWQLPGHDDTTRTRMVRLYAELET